MRLLRCSARALRWRSCFLASLRTRTRRSFAGGGSSVLLATMKSRREQHEIFQRPRSAADIRWRNNSTRRPFVFFGVSPTLAAAFASEKNDDDDKPGRRERTPRAPLHASPGPALLVCVGAAAAALGWKTTHRNTQTCSRANETRAAESSSPTEKHLMKARRRRRRLGLLIC